MNKQALFDFNIAFDECKFFSVTEQTPSKCKQVCEYVSDEKNKDKKIGISIMGDKHKFTFEKLKDHIGYEEEWEEWHNHTHYNYYRWVDSSVAKFIFNEILKMIVADKNNRTLSNNVDEGKN